MNMLLISGGYHGSVSGDVLAYTLPYGLSLKRNDKVLYVSSSHLVVPNSSPTYIKSDF